MTRTDEWEEEYEDCRYNWEQGFDRDGLKAFIRDLLARRDAEIAAVVRGMKLVQTKNETDTDRFYGYGWNFALDELLRRLSPHSPAKSNNPAKIELTTPDSPITPRTLNSEHPPRKECCDESVAEACCGHGRYCEKHLSHSETTKP